MSPCDVDGGSGLRELESDSFANTSGGTCYHTHPTGQGHFLWKGNNTAACCYVDIKYQPEISKLNVTPTKIGDSALD